MKRIALIIILFAVINCKAQNPIINLHTSGLRDIENAYYKDIENFYGQFVGTWVYSDNTKTIRFKFAKKEMFYKRSIKNYYIDYLVGEMQYIQNGVQKINSLDRLDMDFSNIYAYSMSSITKTGYNWAPVCEDCPSNVMRLVMSYDEPTNEDFGLIADFVMRRVVENGVDKLKVQYRWNTGASGVNKFDTELLSGDTDFTIPYGDYTLVREN